MEACNLTVIFNSEVNLAPVGIGQADHGAGQFAIQQPVPVTLKLNGQRFSIRNSAHLL
jgi:hypothetical protein